MQGQNQISTNNLSVGLKIKNYKEMCKLLNEPITTGGAKKNQLKNWERYFSYNKLGQQFIITEIYDEPLEPEYRKYQRGIYIQYVEIILRTLLSTKEEEYYDVTKQQLWRDLGMINRKYKHIELSKLNQELNEYTYTPNEMKAFYRKCDSRLSSILKSSLNSLVSRRIIDCSIQKVIHIKKDNKENIVIANEDFCNKIREIERETLDQMGLKDMEEVRKTLSYEDFYVIRNEIAYERYHWTAIIDKYHITFNKNTILKNIASDEMELKKSMLDFNEKIIEAIDKSNESMIATQHEKAQQLYNERIKEKADTLKIGNLPEYTYKDFNIFDYDEDFLLKTKQLNRHLISIRDEKLSKTEQN